MLREGRYVRREQGKLPTARLAFLDEIFKSNSAILNILLTIINERKFYQDGVPQPVRLRVLFAATNEVPEQAELAALKDRFVLKVESRSRAGRALHRADRLPACRARSYRGLNQKPWVRGPRHARRPAEGEPLPDATCSPAGSAGRGRGAERPAAVLPGGGVPRVPAAGQDAGARGQDLHQRPQAGEALQAVPGAGRGCSPAAPSAATTCGCWRTSARRTRRSSCCARRCRHCWGTGNNQIVSPRPESSRGAFT